MDLDKYKKTWENQEVKTNTVSNLDVYKMSHSKSSSIVRWIFIIGVLELLFWSSLNFIVPQKYMDTYDGFHLVEIIEISTYVHYVVIVVFLILFYRNYNSISITDNTKRLMSRILNVRKTVKYYVYYNLGLIIFSSTFTTIMMIGQPEELTKALNPNGVSIETSTIITRFVVASVILVAIIFLIIGLFYRFTYGRLLKKLNKNFKELDTLEHLN